MVIALDIITVAVIVVCVIIGIKRGFVESIIGLVGLVLALVLTWTFATPLGTAIDNSIVRPWAVKQIVNTQGEEVDIDTPLSELDTAKLYLKITSAFGAQDNQPDGAAKTIGEYVDSFMKRNNLTSAASTALAAIAIFIAVSIAVLIVRLILRPILKLPVLKQCNGLLGAVAGLVNAALILTLIATAVYFYASIPEKGADVYENTVEKTVVFKYAYKYNPIKYLIEK